MKLGWVARVREFHSKLIKIFGEDSIGTFEIEGRLPPSELEELSRRYEHGIANELGKFYITETRRAALSYAGTLSNGLYVSGGFDFFDPATNFSDGFNMAKLWGIAFDDPDSPLGLLLSNSVVFCHIGNGDEIAFDARTLTANSGKVVYLDHEKEHDDSLIPPIADSFDQFMFEWERLGFFDPLQLIEYECIDSEGRLSSSTDFGSELRRMLDIV